MFAIGIILSNYLQGCYRPNLINLSSNRATTGAAISALLSISLLNQLRQGLLLASSYQSIFGSRAGGFAIGVILSNYLHSCYRNDLIKQCSQRAATGAAINVLLSICPSAKPAATRVAIGVILSISLRIEGGRDREGLLSASSYQTIFRVAIGTILSICPLKEPRHGLLSESCYQSVCQTSRDKGCYRQHLITLYLDQGREGLLSASSYQSTC